MSSMTWIVYFLSVLMNMRDSLITIGLLIVVLGIINGIRWGIIYDNDGDTTRPRRTVKFCIGGIVAVTFLVGLFPTERQIVIMASTEVLARTNITGKLEGVSADAMNLLEKWIARETQQIGNDIDKAKTKKD